MKAKIAVAILVVALLALGTSCMSTYEPLPTGYNNVPPLTMTVSSPPTTVYQTPPPPITKVIDMNDRTFVYPAKMCLINVEVGERRVFKFQLHNGNDYDANFRIYCLASPMNELKTPNDLPMADGTYYPVENIENYVSIIGENNETQSVKLVQAKWTENVNCALSIPSNITLPNKLYFYVAASEISGGNIATANAVTVYINMR